MTGHWSARGWQEWGGASESEGRGQVHREASKPHPTPLSNIIQATHFIHLKKCHFTLNLLSQDGHSGPTPSPWEPQKTSYSLSSPPLSVSASPPVLAPCLHLSSSYICSKASIFGLLSFRPSQINGQK